MIRDAYQFGQNQSARTGRQGVDRRAAKLLPTLITEICLTVNV
uniref:Uncharacterized protein n=1 Tax=Anguilla anguilla TaxID=7936 RepID=A0A0E9PZ04_ANGAN